MITELKSIPDIMNPMPREVGDRSRDACDRAAAVERVKKSESATPIVNKIDRR
ncbi:hypothetical protein [Marivita sp.]|uniref:hypothetical protein n=1 Tax=Marivita sp. TaxID=2003365 RepID=UPI0025BA611A|nr:hypothetical protein [Marivita sp.]